MTENKGRILIIEDNKNISLIMADCLTLEGFQVSQAYDGRKGLEMALAEMPDLIILDMILPGLTGLEVIAKIWEDPKAGKFSILIVSVLKKDEAGLEDNVMVVGYIAKPFEMTTLVNEVKRVLANGGAKSRE